MTDAATRRLRLISDFTANDNDLKQSCVNWMEQGDKRLLSMDTVRTFSFICARACSSFLVALTYRLDVPASVQNSTPTIVVHPLRDADTRRTVRHMTR